MRIILTRHGETVENKKGIAQGWLPGHLSTLGKKQAKQLTNLLKEVKIDVIYTSDLARAYDTAKEIAKYHKNCKLIKDKRLREKHLGKKIEGKIWPKMENLSGASRAANIDFAIENNFKFWKRIKSFYKFLLKKYNKEIILIVGHGGSVCFLEGTIHKLDMKQSLAMKLHKNTAISEYEIGKKGKVKVIRINYDEHLK